mmetsp:Transcript_13804/g.44184  ORF Transcript_13804/g.44184 Transcript_13804/m.44184 type:complete len:314 (-) Transcript_13804:120-1061(-)|eukprot:CAMPEP_0196772736 /NCGR_PEP_ID=MMETSP1104-20130614/2395_1 /TAXON_ID=33652 /ORGANISM="Cafeteria sp., Strain Caron Lab Isolate" /LENGTH=313 /DNA_ID=CAMNT_0042142877 /DNA_START=52 /DNA_END=993 /DNA_ORIENTATION=+
MSRRSDSGATASGGALAVGAQRARSSLPLLSPDSARKSAKSSREYLRGAGASIVNIVATFPLNKVMFRQQLDGSTVRSAVYGIYREGAGQLYRGVVPPLLQRSVALALMFGLYDTYYLGLKRRCPGTTPGGVGDVSLRVLAAVGAGSTEAIMTPFERIQTLLQAPQYNGTFRGTYDAMGKLRAFGISEYYRGFTGVLLRNGPSNALFFLLRTPVKNALPPTRSRSMSLMYDFVSGSLLGASISTLFYPINVIKTHMMQRVGGRFIGPVRAVRQVLAVRGSWSKIYRGAHLNFTRACLSWGIINCTYEALGSVI